MRVKHFKVTRKRILENHFWGCEFSVVSFLGGLSLEQFYFPGYWTFDLRGASLSNKCLYVPPPPPPPRGRKLRSAEYQVIKGQIALHIVTDNYLKFEAITAHISEINKTPL